MAKMDMTAENFMTIEDYKALYQDLMKGKTHGIDCFCPSDLYYPWKSLPVNKYRKPRKHHLFFAWLLLHTQRPKKRNDKTVFESNYGPIKKLLAQINKEKFKKLIVEYKSISKGCKDLSEGYKNLNEIYRIASRNQKLLDEMIITKWAALESLFGDKDIAKELESEINKEAREQMKIIIRREVWTRKINNYFEKDLKLFKDWWLRVRILTFVWEKKEVSQRELLRRFSNKKLEDLMRCSILLAIRKLIKWDTKNRKIYYIGPINLNPEIIRRYTFPPSLK